MKLMTKALQARFEKVGSQENEKDPIVIAHFFNPAGAGDWYAIEYDPQEKVFFGYVSIFGDFCDEFSTFSEYDLENVPLPFGLKIERDLCFTEQPLSKCAKTFKPLEKSAY